MFQSRKPKSSRGVRHACKIRLLSDVSRDTTCLRELNTQLPRVIAGRAIHYGLVIVLRGTVAQVGKSAGFQCERSPDQNLHRAKKYPHVTTDW